MKKIITLFVSSLILSLMSSPAVAAIKGNIATTTICSGAIGSFDPTLGFAVGASVVVTTTDVFADSVAVGDFTFNTGTTGLAQSGAGHLTLDETKKQLTIPFIGTAKSGTLTITAAGRVFNAPVNTDSDTINIVVAPCVATTTTIANGAAGASVVVTTTDVFADAVAVGDFTFVVGTTGLTQAGSLTLDETKKQVAIPFIGTAKSGTLTITAAALAFGVTATAASNTLSIVVEPAVTTTSPKVTVTTPDTSPAPTPGFFSGAKWTITVDDAGVSTLDINLAKSQAGKNASFYKRTKQGKLILLDEEQRLGKNGKASITTDKLLRTGQKVRVQVDGKFRSTVTMP